MKASRLATEGRVGTGNNRGLKIQAYGDQNDYPQRVREIIEASVTGASCLNIYQKFVTGRGFAASGLDDIVVNGAGATLRELCKAVGNDLAEWGGFAIHVNWNALFRITSMTHVPFEFVRFEELDKDGRWSKYVVHQDWGRRYTKLRPFNIKDAVTYNAFSPDPETILSQVEEAGGWNGYHGQILYFSNRGGGVYPLPIFDAALTDMSNEEGLSNLTQRNVRHGFLPSGMLIDHCNGANSEQQIEETKEELREFQGDSNAGKIFYCNVGLGEDKPEFVPFAGHNLDKDFAQAEDKTPGIIGRAFSQPPILRSEDVGGNFGADLMRNAYDFYNSITESERDDISGVFAKLFEWWKDEGVNPDGDWSILPRYYRVNSTLAERLGADTDKVLEVISGPLAPRAKRAVLETVYGMDGEDIDTLLTSFGHADND